MFGALWENRPEHVPLQQGQNPFELAFSLDPTQHRDSDFSPQCEARPGEHPGGGQDMGGSLEK